MPVDSLPLWLSEPNSPSLSVWYVILDPKVHRHTGLSAVMATSPPVCGVLLSVQGKTGCHYGSADLRQDRGGS